MPIISTANYSNLLDSGYTLPLYLTHNSKLLQEKEEFDADMQSYYDLLTKFMVMVKDATWFPQNLLRELLPFGHVFTTIFHGSPKEISYLTQLRVRPGGHINYRMLAYDIALLAGKSEPLLAALALPENTKPDPSSIAEFIDRS
jgi:hypothetical protein